MQSNQQDTTNKGGDSTATSSNVKNLNELPKLSN